MKLVINAVIRISRNRTCRTHAARVTSHPINSRLIRINVTRRGAWLIHCIINVHRHVVPFNYLPCLLRPFFSPFLDQPTLLFLLVPPDPRVRSSPGLATNFSHACGPREPSISLQPPPRFVTSAIVHSSRQFSREFVTDRLLEKVHRLLDR